MDKFAHIGTGLAIHAVKGTRPVRMRDGYPFTEVFTVCGAGRSRPLDVGSFKGSEDTRVTRKRCLAALDK